MAEESGKLTIIANRLGEPREIAEYLTDVTKAYNSLYHLSSMLRTQDKWLNFGPFPFPLVHSFESIDWLAFELPPQNRIFLDVVKVSSPGLWEFLGSLNPLQQIREYLKDRHERLMDKEWRSGTQREKAILENELLRQTVIEKALSNERAMREFYPPGALEDLVWQVVGNNLTRLGKHQDSGLIGGVE